MTRKSLLPPDYDSVVDSFGAAYVDRGPQAIDSNTTIRSSYSDNDFNYYRRNNINPSTPQDIMMECNRAYKDMGTVRQTIDLMSEFACSSIRIKHPNPSNESFYQAWWEKIDGAGFSERFLNILYRLGNVPVYREETVLSRQYQPKLSEEAKNKNIKMNVVPIAYYVLNPMMLHIANPAEAMATGKIQYRLMYGFDTVTSLVEYRKNNQTMPSDIFTQLSKNKFVDIDASKLLMFHYKKDDWEFWAYPVIYPVLSDIKDYNRMKLADRSALDGVISNIRLWRLGSLEHQITPNRSMVNKLRDILARNVAGGVVDIVWDETLDFKESNTNAHQFLGNAKYEPILNAIYEGLGIPPALRTGASSMTTNFVSLQTFIRRLEYGRSVLLDFWNNEIKRIQLAMGFQKPAVITFDQMYLGDESSEKKLLIELADRDIISDDTLREKFGVSSTIEKTRIFNNVTERKEHLLPDKASPYHDPQTSHEMNKLLVQQGVVTPSQVGVELPPPKPGEELIGKTVAKNKPEKEYKPVGSPSNGRPKMSKDKTKRKQRVQKTMTGGSLNDFIWASNAQVEINKLLLPVFLENMGKGDIRAMTATEREFFENTKLHALANLEPYSDVTLENVYSILQVDNGKFAEFVSTANSLEKDFLTKYNRKPTYEEKRDIYAFSYVRINEVNNE